MVCNKTSAFRRGFTLVELLIVMGIIVLVAAVTLPTVKGLISGQKVAQASQIVRTYIESAKSRAIATGRPVAVILDRSQYAGDGGLASANMCIRLSIGEVFPAYTGDWAGAKGFLVDSVATAEHESGYVDAIQIPLAQAASLIDFSTSPPQPTSMVQAGDLIEIGASRRRYFVAGTSYDAATSSVVVSFNNPSETTTGVPMVEGQAILEPVTEPQSFRIYRRPSKSLAGGVSLPRGTCIDLNFSGFGLSGRQFSTDAVHSTSSAPQPNYPPDWPPTSVDDNWNFGPIYIIFDSTGQVSGWFFQNRAFSVASPQLQRGYPGGLVHLLIGETDQMAAVSPLLDMGASAMVNTEDFKTNLMDDDNIWVTINPYNGSVTTSQVQSAESPLPGLFAAGSLDSRLAQARALATNQLQSQAAVE